MNNELKQDALENDEAKNGEAVPRDFRTLLDEVLGGSDEAARELHDRYVVHVLRCVRKRLWRRMRSRFDSQDFVQQVWASVFYDRERLATFETAEELTNFLVALATNKVQTETRKRDARKRAQWLEIHLNEQSNDAAHHPPTRDPTPSAVAMFHDEYDRLLGVESPDVQEIVNLRMRGNTFLEIANQLDIDERTARRVMERLQEEATAPPKKPGDGMRREGASG